MSLTGPLTAGETIHPNPSEGIPAARFPHVRKEACLDRSEGWDGEMEIDVFLLYFGPMPIL